MKRLIFSLFSLSMLSNPLAAQEDAPPKHLRFIPLGERPVWKEKLENDIRIGLEPPKGAMPPTELSVLSGEANLVEFRTSLGSLTEILTLQGDTPKLLLKAGKLGVAQDWLATKIPANPLSLGILYRDPRTMSWNDPKILLLKDDATAFPAGKIRFANVSELMAIIQIGDWKAPKPPKKFGIPPGQISIKDLKVGNNPMRVGYVGPDGAENWIWSNQISVLQNQRVQGFFYKAQGKDPRQKVLYRQAPEPLPRIPSK